MAKITVAGKAVVITSALKLEDIKTVAKYRPKALTLMGGEDGKEPVFKIGVSGSGINQYGASFSDESRDAEKKATITEMIDYDGDKVEEYVSDKYGAALINLNKMEEVLPAVIAEINAEKAQIAANITIAQ